MTDEQVIKALECCFSNKSCKECPLDTNDTDISCLRTIRKEATRLCLRQKAEIIEAQRKIASCNAKFEALQEVKEQLEKDVFNSEMNLEHITYEYELLKQEKTVVKDEAIKEFAERLKEKSRRYPYYEYGLISAVPIEDIDNLVKEMVGE